MVVSWLNAMSKPSFLTAINPTCRLIWMKFDRDPLLFADINMKRGQVRVTVISECRSSYIRIGLYLPTLLTILKLD